MSELKVYLAGGMNKDWRYDLKNTIKNRFYINYKWYTDPTENNTDIPVEYTSLDILKIKRSDIVFCYMEKDNPSGIGLSAEIGYAKALNKTIIFVNESESKYFKFVEELSDVVYNNLKDGVDFLAKCLKGA